MPASDDESNQDLYSCAYDEDRALTGGYSQKDFPHGRSARSKAMLELFTVVFDSRERLMHLLCVRELFSNWPVEHYSNHASVPRSTNGKMNL